MYFWPNNTHCKFCSSKRTEVDTIIDAKTTIERGVKRFVDDHNFISVKSISENVKMLEKFCQNRHIVQVWTVPVHYVYGLKQFDTRVVHVCGTLW